MSSRYRFELNRKGISELMKSEEMQTVLKQYANSVQGYAGEGYTVSVYRNGRTRSNASVHAETREARKDNLENNTLLKALGSVRG